MVTFELRETEGFYLRLQRKSREQPSISQHPGATESETHQGLNKRLENTYLALGIHGHTSEFSRRPLTPGAPVTGGAPGSQMRSTRLAPALEWSPAQE